MNKDLTPRGVVDPSKKPSWLDEVRLDAARNTVEHLKRQEEKREFEEAKARGLKVEDVIGNAKKDLGLEEPQVEEKKEETQTFDSMRKKESKEPK